jgi:MoaA/NifB/PqqE/SkfB family radical SAM enzyme
MFDRNRPYKIHWELTDRCNLKCPMCPRTDALDRCRPVRVIKNTQFWLSDFKKHLPSRFLKRVKRVDFCGNFGEPCLTRDFYEICEFLMIAHGISVMVSSNGSIRKPAWWQKLGLLFAGTDSWVEFHVDGLRDTLACYRIGASWDRIMANAAAFISTGARLDWHYILFKHNQHQVEEACHLARRMGFRNFVATGTSRFPKSGAFRYQHPDGDWRLLEKATIALRGTPETSGVGVSSQGADTAGRPKATVIHCKSSLKNRFYIDATGDVAPCCWVFSRSDQRPGDMRRAIAAAGKSQDEFNLRHRPIEEILADELFFQTFPEQWGKKCFATCLKKCGWQPRMVKRRTEF